MILTPIDNIIHIRDDKEKRMVAQFDPSRGEEGVLIVKQRGAIVDVDLAALIRIVRAAREKPSLP